MVTEVTLRRMSYRKKAAATLEKYLKKKGRGATAALARECLVSLSLPGRWARGEKVPSADGLSRGVLRIAAGIPTEWWARTRRRS
jgi:hypothetical protein